MSQYGLLDPGTCLPTLESICHILDIDEALEFGAGIWSTFSLTRNCKSVTSIENEKEWVIEVEKNYSHKNNLKVIHWKKPMNDYLKETDKKFDLIFIDGNDRIECLNDSFDKSHIIVCHDTHSGNIGWERVSVPKHYKQLSYLGLVPYITTVFYHQDIDLENKLLDRSNYKHKNTFIDEGYWDSSNIIKTHQDNPGKNIEIFVRKVD